jgi:hypothetical protein
MQIRTEHIIFENIASYCDVVDFGNLMTAGNFDLEYVKAVDRWAY